MNANALASYSSAELLRSLAHDLRGHLSRIHLAVSLEASQDAHIAQALSELVLIDLSLRAHVDLTRERPERPREAHALRELAEQVLTEMPQAQAVELDLAPDIEIRVWPEFVQGVLHALLANALRHGAPPIIVSARLGEQFWTLSVIDAGSGFQPAGELFSGGGRRTSTALKNGIGLLVAERLAAILGGSILVECADHRCAVSLRCPLQ